MHPAAPALPEPLRSACDYDWPPIWETSPGSRHRCGYGSCRVLRVNENDVLTYYDPGGRKLGWEPVPDYMCTWRDWWAPILIDSQDDPGRLGRSPAILDAIMRELHDYSVVMGEVAKVYGQLTGDQITKPNAAAHHVLDAVADRENEHVVVILDRLAEALEAAGHAAAARIARNMREDYGGDPDLTIPDSGVAFRVLKAGPFAVHITDDPAWTPDGQLFCDDTLVIISGTSPVRLVCRAADLPGGGEDPQRRDLALQALAGLCHDHGWCADIPAASDEAITIISDQHADAAAAVVAEALRAAGPGPVAWHADADSAAAGRDGVQLVDGTWPVQLYVPAGEAAAADLAARLTRHDGWRAEPSDDGWVTVIPAVPPE
jgi:hypothetical protein